MSSRKVIAGLAVFLIGVSFSIARDIETNDYLVSDDTLKINLGTSTIIISVEDIRDLKDIDKDKMDSVFNVITAQIEQFEKYLEEGKDTTFGSINGDGIKVTIKQNDDMEAGTNTHVPKILSLTLGTRGANASIYSNEEEEDEKKHRDKGKDHLGLNFGLGFNNYIGRQSGKIPSGVDHELNQFQSRYVDFDLIFDFDMGKKGGPVHILTGLELSYHNFMFDNKKRVQKVEGALFFYEDSLRAVKKSKLRATYLSIPAMVMFEFPNQKGKKGFHIGVGGFAGYRIGSKAISKFEKKGNEKIIGNYFLNNVQYGLEARLGYGDITLFGKYSLSPLFVSGKGPDVSAFTLGVTF